MTSELDSVRLRLVEAFLVVAEELHFGRAAERLGVSQSSISEQIRQFEEDIELILFDRSTRVVRISRDGEALLPAARRVVEQIAHFNNRILDVRAGTVTLPLRIGYAPATSQTIMPIVMSRLTTLDPALPLETTMLNVMDIRTALRSNEIDVGLTFTLGELHHTGDWMRLIDDRAIAVMGPTHPFAQHTTLTHEQVADVGIATAPYLSGQNLIDLEAHFLEIGRALRITRRERSQEDLMLHLLAGTNIALGSHWQQTGLEAYGCVTVPLAERIPVAWGLAASPNLNDHVRSLLERVAELIADTPREQLHGPQLVLTPETSTAFG